MDLCDRFDDRWLEQLDQLQSSAPGGSGQLLLDGVFRPALRKLLVRHEWNWAAVFEQLPGHSEEALEVSPIVLTYRAGDGAMHRLLRACSGLPMVSLIVTTDSALDLARRLSQWCVIEADGSAFNFRFPDTRRLPAIAKALHKDQLAQMLGPASHWFCIDRRGSWNALPFEAGVQPSQGLPKLDDRQFAQLVKDSEPDEMLARLDPALESQLMALRPSQRFEVAASALVAADDAGVSEPFDRLRLVVDALEKAVERESA